MEQGLGASLSVRLALPDGWPGVVYRPLAPSVSRQVALAMLDRSALSTAARAFVALAAAHPGLQDA